MREFINPQQNNQGYRPQNQTYAPPMQRQEIRYNQGGDSGRGQGLFGRILSFIPKMFNSKKKLLIWLIILGIGTGTFFLIKHFKKPKQEAQVYEALVMVVDQKAADPVEDARSSLKKGDVIAIFPEGHSWSDTEKISYLIIKLKITPDEANKLTQPKTKEVKVDRKGEDAKNMPDKDVQTVLARQYTLDLPSFDTQKFWSEQKQPFEGKVFSGSIIRKK
jgi:hypothetical protein